MPEASEACRMRQHLTHSAVQSILAISDKAFSLFCWGWSTITHCRYNLLVDTLFFTVLKRCRPKEGRSLAGSLTFQEQVFVCERSYFELPKTESRVHTKRVA